MWTVFVMCLCVREALPESPFAAKSEDLAPKKRTWRVKLNMLLTERDQTTGDHMVSS